MTQGKKAKLEIIQADGPEDALIFERALLGGLAALVPLPFVDDVLLRRSRRVLFRDLARRARMELDDHALGVLTTEPRRIVAGTVQSALGRLFRRASVPLLVAARARGALQTFQLATLFDHYARLRHSGLDLDEDGATKLRALFDAVMAATPPKLAALRDPSLYAAQLREAFDARWLEELKG